MTPLGQESITTLGFKIKICYGKQLGRPRVNYLSK